MAVSQVMRKGRLVWALDFYHPSFTNGRKQVTAKIQNKHGAEAEYQARLMSLISRGTLEHAGTADTPTLAEFWDEVYSPLKLPKLTQATRESYESVWSRKGGVKSSMGKLRLNQIDGPAVVRLSAALVKRGVKPKAQVVLVKSLLSFAKAMKVLDKLPEWPRGLYSESDKLPDSPSVDEMTRALATAEGWIQTATALVVYTGMRQGEARGLRVRDVDLAQSVISIRVAFSGNVESTTKGKRERWVPIHPDLVPFLVTAMAGKGLDDRLVINTKGKTPTRQEVLNAWKKVLKKANLPERAFHPTRHFVATTMLRGGTDPETVRQMMGHSSIAILDRYIHTDGPTMRKAVASIPTLQ